MKSTTRKHIRLVSLVMAIAVVGMLAALVALSGGFVQPGGALAQGGNPVSPFTPNTATPEPTAVPMTATPVPQAPVAVIATSSESVAMGGSITVNVAPYFTDGDSSTLTYGAVSTNMAAATVAVTGSMVTISGVNTGTSTVVVTATDEDNLTARHTMSVMVMGVATPTPEPGTGPGPGTQVPDVKNDISTDSTSSGAGIKVTVKIGNLPMNMRAGSSVVLYLEDDFQVPDSIARNTVYFTATNPHRVRTGEGGRVYATDPIEISDDDYFGGGDDWSIRVYLPDFNTGDDYDGFQGPDMNQTLTMVITEAGGIKNPTEAHDSDNDYEDGYKASYDILTVTGDVKGTPPADGTLRPDGDTTSDPKTNFDDLIVKAKISLSDEDNTRGYTLTVTGSGFNNGTSAAVHVLADDSSNPDLAALLSSNEDALCRLIISSGDRAGIATVGSDDKVAVEFDVTVPVFKPGNVNYLCMVDGEGRRSFDDVEQFKLEPSIRVSPSAVNAGDTINVYAQDFPNTGAAMSSLKIANTQVYSDDRDEQAAIQGPPVDNSVDVTAGSIGTDGSATATFDLPGSISGVPLEGTVRIDAAWGRKPANAAGVRNPDVSEDTKVTVTGSTLRLSQGSARSNESITIQGEGFGTGSNVTIDPADITLDGVPLLVDDDSLTGEKVEVSNAGQFVATVYLWQAGGTSARDSDNPALIAGTHTVRVRDSEGFFGTATIAIEEPTLTIRDKTRRPRQDLIIVGANWPVDNQDSTANVGSVQITVENRTYTEIPDAAGNFNLVHKVGRNVAIPSTQQVRASYGSQIVKVESFEVPAATIVISPTEGRPGDELTLTVEKMPPITEVDEVTIGGANALGGRYFRTNFEGEVVARGIVIPGLDPGTYSVVMKVGSGASQTVAIGSVTVLEGDRTRGSAELPDALSTLEDNLLAVFYLDNVTKEWSFFDPRPEFAELNTLTGLTDGEPYLLLVGEDAEEVVLNDKTRNLTCVGGNCLNQLVW